MKRTWLLDIEVFGNFFFIGVKDYRTKEILKFEVSDKKDDRKEIYTVFNSFDGYLVTFNGISYDQIVINFIVKEYKSLSKLSVTEFLKTVKNFSNQVIEDNFEEIKWYKWFKVKYEAIDLFLYWSKGLRISKKISLKSLAIQLNFDEIQELPYEHTKTLSQEEIDIVIRYNLRNDLGILEALFEKMKPDIELRHYILHEYGVKCWSMDAPKIASEYLLDKFCKKTWDKREDFNKYLNEKRKYRYVPPYGWKIGDFLPPVKFKTKIFQDLYKEICESGNKFSKEFAYINKNTRVIISMGIGGIHILNENEVYRKKEGFTIIDQDVASLYPQLIKNHRFLRKELEIVIDEYLAIKTDRIAAKREGNKTKDKFLKLVLNSFTGIADSDVTWVYSPEQLTALRVYGQLIQLRVLEELSEIGIQVVSNNTDGTTAIVPNELIDRYHQINSDISKEFNVTWEYAVIDGIFYANVNNYLCIVSQGYMINDETQEKINVKDKIEVKRKGFFKFGYDIPLGDSVNEQVIPKALNLFFTEGVPLEESISNPDKFGFEIFDYCKSNKINKDYDVFHNQKKVQNLNRYYFTQGAPYLMKKKKNKKTGTYEHVNVGEGVTIFNIYEKKDWKDYNINYRYYIVKAREIVNKITKSERELTLF